MKQWVVLFLLIIFYSCNETEQAEGSPSSADSISNTLFLLNDTIPDTLYKSELRLGEKVPLGKVFTDSVAFVERDDSGDYFLFFIRKNNRLLSLVYDNLAGRIPDFSRGDTLAIQWKMDSLFIAGDGEKLDFSEWLIDVKRIKDGKVAAFRETYTRPLKYWYAVDSDYTDELKDYLYQLVEYYIAYSQQPLVLLHLQQPEQTDFVYSIEERKEKGRNYIVLGLSNDQGTHSTIIQWLYLDVETHMLYEYDLANDQLIPFP